MYLLLLLALSRKLDKIAVQEIYRYTVVSLLWYLTPSSLAKMKCLLKNHVSRDQALRDSVAVSIVMNPRDIGQDALLGHFDANPGKRREPQTPI